MRWQKLFKMWYDGVPWRQIREEVDNDNAEKKEISRVFKQIRQGITPKPKINRLRAATCSHDDVKLRGVHPVTLQPKTGICNKCGKYVEAKIMWK